MSSLCLHNGFSDLRYHSNILEQADRYASLPTDLLLGVAAANYLSRYLEHRSDVDLALFSIKVKRFTATLD